MPSTFDRTVPATTERRGAGEPDRVLRNAAWFVAFLLSPVQMALLSRALGADGFGRWWWTAVWIEAASLLGMLSADLYVRRTLPAHAGDAAAIHRVLGSALAVAGGAGLVIGLLQAVGAHALARTQGDPELAVYLQTLAVMPLLANLSAILAAGLQSADAYRAIAFVRGVGGPLLACAFLAVAWQRAMSPSLVLRGIVAVHALTLLAATLTYARHFDLRATLASALAPREAPRVIASGASLLLPNLLWAVGGKIDLYMLRSHVGPATLGVYAGCLQLAAVLPYTRTIFDPVAQAQIGAAAASARAALADSLRGLSRLCALALLPFFVGLVAMGEPVLSMLLGRSAAGAALPLAILSVGQLFGSMALASWLAPMLLPGRFLSVLAALTLAWKVLVITLLAPKLGMVGAAIATATGTIVAQHGAAVMSGRLLRMHLYSRTIARSLLGVLLLGAAAGLVHLGVARTSSASVALALGALATAALSLLGLVTLLGADERGWVAGWLRARLRRE